MTETVDSIQLITGIMTFCSAIGALAGVRHQHLSTLIRAKTEQLQTISVSLDKDVDLKITNLAYQIDTFCIRNGRLRYSVAACVVAVITSLYALAWPMICEQLPSLLNCIIGLANKLILNIGLALLVAGGSMILALFLVAWEFWCSPDTIDAELLLSQTYDPRAQFISRKKKLEKFRKEIEEYKDKCLPKDET
jgi:hypothetical protein